MFHRGISFSAARLLILGLLLLGCPFVARAQRHGGGQGIGTLTGAAGRPDGVDQKDSLRDFHQALAVQATGQQIAEFQTLVKNTEAAQAALRSLQQQLEKGSRDALATDALDRALESARNGSKKFEEGFSPEQKSGLREISKRLDKSESDLDQEQKRFDQSLDLKTAGSDTHTENLARALGDFSNQQLALGREMSITLANGQDLAFTLPPVKSPVNIGKQTVGVTVFGTLSQTAVQGVQRTFRLTLVDDLSDVEQNITELLRAELDSSQTCGQRVAIRQATLAPQTPASLLVIKLHYERWSCSGAFGQQAATELAEGDGSMEIKLTATVEKGMVKIVAAPGRVDATGMMGEALRSGSLGEDLREQAARVVLSGAQAGSNFKITLPLAVQNSAALQTARFQDTGVGSLSVVLGGQVEISNEQADQLASQLNQALSAQGNPASGEVPQLVTRPQ
jgi:hypothetical protein